MVMNWRDSDMVVGEKGYTTCFSFGGLPAYWQWKSYTNLASSYGSDSLFNVNPKLPSTLSGVQNSQESFLDSSRV
jgi:hypothetical protein